MVRLWTDLKFAPALGCVKNCTELACLLYEVMKKCYGQRPARSDEVRETEYGWTVRERGRVILGGISGTQEKSNHSSGYIE